MKIPFPVIPTDRRTTEEIVYDTMKSYTPAMYVKTFYTFTLSDIQCKSGVSYARLARLYRKDPKLFLMICRGY